MRKHLTISSYITASLGSFSNNDGDRRESVTIKKSSGLKSVAIISICLKCQMQVNFSGIEFLATERKFRGRKKKFRPDKFMSSIKRRPAR